MTVDSMAQSAQGSGNADLLVENGLLQLLKLQEVDGELQVLEEVKSKYPTEISTRQSEIDRSQSLLHQQLEQLEEFGREQRHCERELDSTRADLKTHEERFSSVSTNKEYDALQMEIEACKTRISEYETRSLELLEAVEELQKKIEIEKQKSESVRQEQQAAIDELQGKLDSLQSEVDSVQARREAVARTIEAHLLTLYERHRKKRGQRVAPVRKGACGTCFRELPAQQKSYVRRSEQIHQCEHCGAILVWDANSS